MSEGGLQLLAGTQEAGVVIPLAVDDVEAQGASALVSNEHRADELVLADLPTGHDGELPLEIRVVFTHRQELGRPLGLQPEFVQLLKELGLRRILVVADLALEVDEDELALTALTRLDGEVLIVQVGIDGVVPTRIPHLVEGARVVEWHPDGCNGGLAHLIQEVSTELAVAVVLHELTDGARLETTLIKKAVKLLSWAQD